MILSNAELHRALDEGRLVIDPQPSPKFPQVKGPHCPYDTHSVDLTLGDAIDEPLSGTFSIDLLQPGSIAETIGRNSQHHTLSPQGYKLEPGKFVLGITKETVGLPIQAEPDRSLAARIEGKSSRARFGMLVHFTAPTVHPNWNGPLALEIINLGKWAITLTPGMAIAQLIVEEVRGVPLRNDSQFQGQSAPAGVLAGHAS